MKPPSWELLQKRPTYDTQKHVPEPWSRPCLGVCQKSLRSAGGGVNNESFVFIENSTVFFVFQAFSGPQQYVKQWPKTSKKGRTKDIASHTFGVQVD